MNQQTMRNMSTVRVLPLATLALMLASPAAPAQANPRTVRPEDARFSAVLRGRTMVVDRLGRRAVHLLPLDTTVTKDDDMIAVLDGARFTDGTISVAVAGAPRPGAPPDSRGFIGIAFRMGDRGEWSEIFYLRPTNGRAEDQLRRNHTLQYVSHPDFPWYKLREEQPGRYESYADMEAGTWTTMRIVVRGTTARLYIGGAEQPALVVTDLKHGAGPGRIGLWAHIQTDAYFGALTITPR